jgi:hypothetical protein
MWLSSIIESFCQFIASRCDIYMICRFSCLLFFPLSSLFLPLSHYPSHPPSLPTSLLTIFQASLPATLHITSSFPLLLAFLPTVLPSSIPAFYNLPSPIVLNFPFHVTMSLMTPPPQKKTSQNYSPSYSLFTSPSFTVLHLVLPSLSPLPYTLGSVISLPNSIGERLTS